MNNNQGGIVSATTPEDREYARMMYEEQAEHARLHEEMRGTATGIFIALIAGLLAFAAGREQMIGLLICGVSIIGALVSYKHYERYNLHLVRLRGYRRSLEQGITAGLSDINRICDASHNANYCFTHRWIKLHVVWLIIYLCTFVVGLLLVALGRDIFGVGK